MRAISQSVRAIWTCSFDCVFSKCARAERRVWRLFVRFLPAQDHPPDPVDVGETFGEPGRLEQGLRLLGLGLRFRDLSFRQSE